MKPFRLFTHFAVFLLLLLFSCEPSSHEAEKYLQNLNNVISGVVKMEDSLIVLINSRMLESSKTTAIIEEEEEGGDQATDIQQRVVYTVHQAFKDSINLALEKAKKLPAFDGNDEVKNSLISVLTVYKDLCLNEYLEIIEVSLTPSILYTEEDDKNFMRLSAKIDSSLEKNINDFNQIQKEFLAKYQKK